MNRKSLGILAIIIIALMALVAMAGLDNLPRDLKSSVAAAQTRIATDRSTFDQQRTAINRALQDEPALFRSRSASMQAGIEQAQANISKAEAELGALQKLAQEIIAGPQE